MILDKIKAATLERVTALKSKKSFNAVRSEAESLPADKNFKTAIGKEGLNIIAELKKASPSKGIISGNFNDIYLQKAIAYEKGDAAAISCLTEPYFFLGSDEYLQQVKKVVNLPILRKDFIVDEYQIYEAKSIGADAILLICSILETVQLNEYLQIAKELKLSVLTEVHNEYEMETALNADADIIGVNNRNLKDFNVNKENSLNLKKLMPKDKIFVAESGIKNIEDIKILKNAGINTALIGEALMREINAEQLIMKMRGEFYES